MSAEREFWCRKMTAILMSKSILWDAEIILGVKKTEVTVGMKAEINGQLYGDYVKLTREQVMDCDLYDSIERTIDDLGCELGRTKIALGVKAGEEEQHGEEG